MTAPKFRAECSECGAWSPRPTSPFTVEKWMRSHTTSHLAPTCEHDWRPLGVHGSLRCRACGLDDHTQNRLKETR